MKKWNFEVHTVFVVEGENIDEATDNFVKNAPTTPLPYSVTFIETSPVEEEVKSADGECSV